MRRKVTIIGGGVCALMLGCELDPKKFDVAVYEKNAAVARKFLVAGDGGLNLTHSEPEEDFIKRYTPPDFLAKAFQQFSNRDLVSWLHELGVETYTGSSGRVFPLKTIKPVAVLNMLLEKMKSMGAILHVKQEWIGFSKYNDVMVTHNNRRKEIKSDYVIFCLGGASWPVTGSKGDWPHYFSEKDIRVNPFMASNCAFKIAWPEDLLLKAEGSALKNITITCNHVTHAGEVIITYFGLEGSGIYPLSPQIREQLLKRGKAEITIDLKPALSEARLTEKLNSKAADINLTEHLKTQLNLSDTHISLLKHLVSKEDFMTPEKLCHHIKNLTVTITGLGPVEDAISTVGGIALEEVDRHFQLKKLPGYFAIGEMLDYDAPTGGYLLQSCFSMGKLLADHLNAQ